MHFQMSHPSNAIFVECTFYVNVTLAIERCVHLIFFCISDKTKKNV